MQTDSITQDEAASPELEEQVLELFRQCFSRSDIGLDDDFFRLGGDSMMATRLLARLGELCDADLQPDALFAYSSPGALAQAIGGIRPESGREGCACLMPLNRGGEGRPVFLVHGTSANPWVFRPLVNHARLKRPVFGMRAPDLDWDRDVLSIPEMASLYAAEIRLVQRRGPYSIAGYSFGGNLAFEIANRLVRDGQEVRDLVLFDAPGPLSILGRISSGARIMDAVRRRLCRLGPLGSAILDRFGFDSPMRRVFLCFGTGPLTDDELRRVARIAFPQAARRLRLEELPFEEVCDAIVAQLRLIVATNSILEYLVRRAPAERASVLVKAHKVWAKNHWLALQHRPKDVYPGKIIIYAARDNAGVLRWQKHSAKPLDVRWVPIGREVHEDFLEEEWVGLFATDFRELLGSGLHSDRPVSIRPIERGRSNRFAL